MPDNSNYFPLISEHSLFDAAILANGDYPTHAIPQAILHRTRPLVCCDGAGSEAISRGLMPTAIIGDGDSCRCEKCIRSPVPSGRRTRRQRLDKSDTLHLGEATLHSTQSEDCLPCHDRQAGRPHTGQHRTHGALLPPIPHHPHSHHRLWEFHDCARHFPFRDPSTATDKHFQPFVFFTQR